MFQNIPDDWKKTIISVVAVFFLSLALFFESWFSIFEIWNRSKTYTHGFLIIPISFWLIWTQRKYYITLHPKIDWKVTAIILGCGFIWLLADLANVQVIKQYATVGLLVSGLWLVLGSIAKEMIFPLFFLFFMVPVGEELVPYLMEFTATFTVNLIRYTGISVYREGMYFTLTSGNWSVVEACSGINYLIASITLGVVYAYITYTRLWKRCLFILLSIVVPIFANGFRAYLIVMIGHFSNMKYAVGVDHLIYGGVFFGLVMLVLFFLGSFWKDPVKHAVNNNSEVLLQKTKAIKEKEIKAFIPQISYILLIIGLSYSIWPFTSSWLSSQQQNNIVVAQNFPELEKKSWNKMGIQNWNWQPDYQDVVDDSIIYFSKNKNVIAIYQASFGKETQGGGELINSNNLLISGNNKFWKIVNKGKVKINANFNKQLTLEEITLRGARGDLLAFRWYRIGKYNTSNKYLAKWYQLKNRLLANSAQESAIILAIQTPINRHEVAREILLDVVKIMLTSEGKERTQNNFDN